MKAGGSSGLFRIVGEVEQARLQPMVFSVTTVVVFLFVASAQVLMRDFC